MHTPKFKKLALAAVIAGVSQGANAFSISATDDAALLADSLLIPGSGITVTSASLNFGMPVGGFDGELPPPPIGDGDGELVGEPGSEFDGDIPPPPLGDGGDVVYSGNQAGTYTNGAGTYGLPGPGIVLSSGFVENYETGPNLHDSLTGSNGTQATQEQNDLLSGVTGFTQHFDPVQLSISFDVDDSTDTISFFAAFGSEEWPEFVGDFTDGFGLFLNGENVAGALPTGGVAGVDPLLPINIDHPDMTDIPGTELDGVLAPNGVPLLRFDVPVDPGSSNVFEVIVADALDSAVDTTVYISSFGNFSDESGGSEFTPVMPSNPEDLDGGFVFQLPEVTEEEVIWIDPFIATGYTYTVKDGGLFDAVVAPTQFSVNDADGYTIEYYDAAGNLVVVNLSPGGSYNFSNPVSEFVLKGIDESLMLDPTDGNAFVTGLSFATAGQFEVSQVAIQKYVDVSAPGSLALFGLGLAGLSLVRRRKA
jgi:hypothetical protein